ncbi:MAG TPA: MltA domain-containing protein [Terriglobales bacterium]|nr:MltA domain-containing protein [Terriglobales bacterium]
MNAPSAPTAPRARRHRLRAAIVTILALVAACTSAKPAPKAPLGPQLVRLDPAACREVLRDDSSLETLQHAAVRSGAYFTEDAPPSTSFFGRPLLRNNLAAIASTAAEATSLEVFAGTLCDRVAVYRVELKDPLQVTGYVEAPIAARRQPGNGYSYAIYEPPTDLVELDVSAICPNCEQRLAQGRLAGSRVTPYYSRAEIEAGAIAGQDYELAWLDDPVDALLLELRGSGVLQFEDGTRMNLAYASSNGRSASDPLAMLAGSGQPADFAALRAHLRARPEEAAAVLRARERVVFFGVAPVGPVGSIGTPITAGRTVAADPRIYPRGLLAFVRSGATERDAPQLSRFVFVQDDQPGLRGAERLGLFAGEDPSAELAQLRGNAELYVILPE